MGYAISWIAFRGKTDAQAAELLGLSPSGKFEEVPESAYLTSRSNSPKRLWDASTIECATAGLRILKPLVVTAGGGPLSRLFRESS